jgi:membrane protein
MAATAGGGGHGPSDISTRGWWSVLRRVARSTFEDDLWGVSAGVAFYAWFAAVFGLMFLVSTYGLFVASETVRGQIEALNGLLPDEATHFLADQMQAVAAASSFRLGSAVGGSFLAALWSARAALATLIAALNITYDEREDRHFLHLQTVTLALTAGAVVFGAAVFAITVLLPAIVDTMSISPTAKIVLSTGRWPALAVLMVFGLAALYRFAPCRRAMPSWRWVNGGAVVATVLWLLGSVGFSYYVTHFSTTSRIFGALGTVLVLQTWFYISAFAVLIGARLNAEMERQNVGENSPRA